LRSLNILLYVFILMCFCLVAMALELDPDKFMTVDKIKPGMKGIGKTVFSGTKIDEFQVEVLEVVKNAMGPKSDIIWVLCSGGPLEEAGVMSGMSGSPIYIDGKLVGAIAYRAGSFAKRPIAGVTPIADMLRVIETAEKGSLTEQGELDEWNFPFPLRGESDKGYEEVDRTFDTGFASLSPVQTPIAMSGFNPRTIDYVAPVFKKFGMIPVQGGGAPSGTQSEEVKLEPGAVLGIEFVRGDSIAFGYGTLTYIQDDKVLAFGHPMYGMGKTSLPASVGRISFLVPSLLASFKLGSPTKTIGTLTQDDQYGIMSVVGKMPEFIPMKVKFRQNNQVREYNFEIAKHRFFSPSFIFTTALDTILSAGKSMGDYTIKTHSEINLKGYPVISKDNVFSGLYPDIAAAEFATPLYTLMQNRFEEVDVENILLEVSFEDRRTNALIDDVQINKAQIKPGDPLNIKVSITPYMQDTIVKEIEIIIPKDAPEGRSFLRISDAISSDSWERARAPMKSRITDMPHLIRQIQEGESNNDIIVELFTPKAGVTIRGEELPALPLTAFSVISSSKQVGGSGFTQGTTFLKQRVHTDYVISGSAMLPLIIDRDAP